MHVDRRRSVRIPADFSVQIETLRGQCVDFSKGGMRVRADWSVPVGLPIEVVLTGIGSGCCRVRGRVVHWYDREGDFSLRFTRIQRGAARELSSVMRRRRTGSVVSMIG